MTSRPVLSTLAMVVGELAPIAKKAKEAVQSKTKDVESTVKDQFNEIH